MRNLDIAVIGLSCRVPGATNVEQLWENLVYGREAIIAFSDEELRQEGLADQFLNDPHFVKAGTALEGVTCFDESFFGFTPREAQMMDPQPRMFLELAWEVIEQAGYNPQTYKRPIGVYAGMSSSQRETSQSWEDSSSAFLNAIGTEKDFLATIAAYKLNLTGPAISVQTACSTSLVAVHLACQGLIAGDCALAIAGGVSIAEAAQKGYLYEPDGILSPDGHCRAFDARAEGTIPGQGAGVVLLKRLKEAVADGDVIHAVIRGSAVNNDGSLKVGYTAPGVEGQARAIRAAQLAADVEAQSISYIEAHGTATALGDPIEIAALTRAFRATTQKKSFCAIGSIKTNIGHLDTAAGVVGLIKTILALKHKQLPASLHFEAPNPKMDIESTPFFVNCHLREWSGPRPLRAGVSSFGIGGTNAHVIVEEAPEKEASPPGRAVQLLVLSARTQTALEVATHNLANHLRGHCDLELADVAYTLQVGRREFAHRRTVVCRTREEAIRDLEATSPATLQGRTADHQGCAVVLMFPGQGAQFVGMGQQIYEEERIFRDVVTSCSEKLKPQMGVDLRELLYPVDEKREWAQARLGETAITQPAMFVVEYALARLWMRWGIQPQAMLGHSIGEYATACLAGVMSEDDALRLVSIRGRLMQEQAAGSMLAVELSEEDARAELKPGLWLAAVNGSKRCVLSGTHEAIAEAQERLESRFISCHRLRTSHPFHSGMTEPLLERFADAAKGVKLSSPQLPYISNISGEWMTEKEATDPGYWVRHLRQTVRFGTGIETIFRDVSGCVFLEVGPGDTLAGMVREEGNRQHKKPIVVSCLPRGTRTGEKASLLNAAGKLWTAGARLQWRELHEGERRLRVSLPTYPFERKSYSVSRDSPQNKAASTADRRKQADTANWFYAPVWKQAPLLQGRERPQDLDWLIFLDDRGLGNNIAEQVTKAGHKVVLVHKGEQLTFDENAFTINPTVPDHYLALVAELARRKRIPQKVMHLWSIPARKAPAQTSSIDKDHVGFVSLLFLLQSLDQQNVISPIQLAVITADAHLITGYETISPASATVLGACLVIPQEYPNLQCRCIDISLSDFSSPSDAKRQPAFAKGLASDHAQFLTAYRRGQRWVRTFDKVRLAEGTRRSTRLREGGVYLITGGLGRIGLEVAEYLARNVKAKLVLMGRTKLPAPEEWDACLGLYPKDSAKYRQLEKLSSLRKLGGEILVSSADVSNREEVRQVISDTHERFGPIHGVIHAAGVTDPAFLKPIEQLTMNDVEAHFGPKVIGLDILQASLADEPLDFMLLASSLSAILGGIGYSAYAAANVFMDAFSHWWRQQGFCPCISINWDAWDFSGVVEDRAPAGSTLALAMLPREGIEALERLFQEDELVSQIAVSTADLTERIMQWVEQPMERPGSLTPSSSPMDETESHVARTLENALGIAKIGRHDNFIDLGVHSLLALQIISELRTIFNVKLRVADIYDHQDVASLHAYIVQLLNPGSDGQQASSKATPDLLNASSEKVGTDAMLPLVRLRTTGSKSPLYLPHPIGGDVHPYRELTRFLREDRPVIALQNLDQGLGGRQYSTLEEMAAHYLEAISAAQPQGFYLLGGWSMGAVLAFEIAAQLKMHGKEVRLLTMIDPPICNGTHSGGRDRIVGATDSLIAMADYMILTGGKSSSLTRTDLAGLGWPEQLKFVLRHLQQAGVLHADVTDATFSDAASTYANHLKVLRGYNPKFQETPLLFLKAIEADPQADGPVEWESEIWWKRFAKGPFIARGIPGNHVTMMRGNNLQILAEILQRHLDNVDALHENGSARALLV